MLASLITGVGLGAVYDVTALFPAICGRVFDVGMNEKLNNIKLPIINRTLQRRKGNTNAVVKGIGMFFHDFVFMCTAGVVISLLVYRLNDGQWRFGVPICCIFGFAFYRMVFRKIGLVTVELVCFATKCVAVYTVYFTVTPIKKIILKAATAVKTVANRANAKRLKRYIAKYSEIEKRKLLAEAKNGCLGINIKLENDQNSKRKDVRIKNDRCKQKKQNNNMDNDNAACGVGNSCDRQSYGI